MLRQQVDALGCRGFLLLKIGMKIKNTKHKGVVARLNISEAGSVQCYATAIDTCGKHRSWRKTGSSPISGDVYALWVFSYETSRNAPPEPRLTMTPPEKPRPTWKRHIRESWGFGRPGIPGKAVSVPFFPGGPLQHGAVALTPLTRAGHAHPPLPSWEDRALPFAS